MLEGAGVESAGQDDKLWASKFLRLISTQSLWIFKFSTTVDLEASVLASKSAMLESISFKSDRTCSMEVLMAVRF